MTKKLTKKQKEILYKCWKDAQTTKERLILIEQRLPKVPSLAALSTMRRMAKTDPKWIKMATRRKNQQEKEKLAKQQEKLARRKEKEKKRKEREEKRKVRNKKQKHKQILTHLRENLKIHHWKEVSQQVESNFFFCSNLHQFVNNISCIFRIFSDEHIIARMPCCDKCMRFNDHIDMLKEIINESKTKKIRRHSPSKRGRKIKKQNTTTEKTETTTASSTEC